MPELPEVETVRRDLQRCAGGALIGRVEVRDGRPLRGAPAGSLARSLRGRRFTGFARRGKYLLCSLSSGKTLVIHLRMTGMLLHQSVRDPMPAMARIVFHLSGGRRLVFADQRRFGSVELAGDPLSLPGIRTLGPEPLGRNFTPASLRAALQGRSGPVKTALLDQRTVAGLGNIYVLEALHRAGISPKRKSCGLTRAEIESLHQAIRAVLRAAIAARGSSVDTYRDGRGRRGWFQVKHRVYGREGRACPRCGTAIRKEQFRGRGTYWCPGCQR